MNFRFAVVAAAALTSLAATPLVVKAAGGASGAARPVAAPAAPAIAQTTPAPAPCGKPVRVVYAGYAPACAR
ncbi:hypothetical protein [uncultured Methylobacterium sp.]|uniref:hypothetical protein n=1 Tax=uncultured Methylobacterium sp. TaxID=157278 RepID=UPI002628B211|nr:hypothetical protein [uncultured Methylobacterium sp.]